MRLNIPLLVDNFTLKVEEIILVCSFSSVMRNNSNRKLSQTQFTSLIQRECKFRALSETLNQNNGTFRFTGYGEVNCNKKWKMYIMLDIKLFLPKNTTYILFGSKANRGKVRIQQKQFQRISHATWVKGISKPMDTRFFNISSKTQIQRNLRKLSSQRPEDSLQSSQAIRFFSTDRTGERPTASPHCCHLPTAAARPQV